MWDGFVCYFFNWWSLFPFSFLNLFYISQNMTLTLSDMFQPQVLASASFWPSSPWCIVTFLAYLEMSMSQPKIHINMCGFYQCFDTHFNDHPVSLSLGPKKRWKKWIHICKVHQWNDMQSYIPDLFEPGQCTYVAKGWCKGDCKTFAGGSGERDALNRAHVVYANVSSLKEPSTNELPGVFLIDICS